jgi:hypothetical protein
MKGAASPEAAPDRKYYIEMLIAIPTLGLRRGAKLKTVNLDQSFLADLCHSGGRRSFDEVYGKTRMFAVRW